MISTFQLLTRASTSIILDRWFQMQTAWWISNSNNSIKVYIMLLVGEVPTNLKKTWLLRLMRNPTIKMTALSEAKVGLFHRCKTTITEDWLREHLTPDPGYPTVHHLTLTQQRLWTSINPQTKWQYSHRCSSLIPLRRVQLSISLTRRWNRKETT